MYDQALVWNTDTDLEVTSFTARLRDLAGIGNVYSRVHVGDLWSPNDPYGLVVTAHRWALEGESVAFEIPVGGTTYGFTLDPMQGPDGSVIGVSGRAHDLIAGALLAARELGEVESQAGIGTWRTDLRTGAVAISAGLAAMLGLDCNVATLDVRAYDHPEDREHIARIVADDPTAYTCDHRMICGGGRVRAVRERVRSVYDERGMALARIGTLLDITDLKEREAELADLALYDPLTHLPNRVLLAERLTAALARVHRHEAHCAVLFIDLDEFKDVNDSRGHAVGDRVLTLLASRLQRHVRATDTVARLGGDEFVILLEDLYSEEAAISAAHKVLAGVEEPLILEDGTAVALSASIGVAIAPRFDGPPEELLSIADREMYHAKRQGGRCVRVADIAEQESNVSFAEKVTCLPRSLKGHTRFGIRESA